MGEEIEDWVVLGSNDEMGGSDEKEDIVFEDKIEMTLDVGRVKADEVVKKQALTEESPLG